MCACFGERGGAPVAAAEATPAGEASGSVSLTFALVRTDIMQDGHSSRISLFLASLTIGAARAAIVIARQDAWHVILNLGVSPPLVFHQGG